MGTPQRKYLGPRMNRFSFFFSSVLFFFGELVVLKCFGPRLGGNLMDVRQLHAAENSIKICSWCLDTEFGLWAKHTACSGGVTAAGCSHMRGKCSRPRRRKMASERLPPVSLRSVLCPGNTAGDLWPRGSARCSMLDAVSVLFPCADSSSRALPPLRSGLWIELSPQTQNWHTDKMCMEEDSRTQTPHRSSSKPKTYFWMIKSKNKTNPNTSSLFLSAWHVVVQCFHRFLCCRWIVKLRG